MAELRALEARPKALDLPGTSPDPAQTPSLSVPRNSVKYTGALISVYIRSRFKMNPSKPHLGLVYTVFVLVQLCRLGASTPNPRSLPLTEAVACLSLTPLLGAGACRKRLGVGLWGLSVSPVLEGVEPGRDALHSPLAALICVQDELDGFLHPQLRLQAEEMFLPGAAALGQH